MILRSLLFGCALGLMIFEIIQRACDGDWAVAGLLGIVWVAGVWAIAFGTGLGGPEGPEPGKPSPRFARHPISQGEAL